jgi:uncharacterized membrane protein YebE (DUF533 family)
MRLGPIVGSLLGAFGGRALGGAIGGNTGRMIGSLAGSMLGSSGIGGIGALFSKLTGGNNNNNTTNTDITQPPAANLPAAHLTGAAPYEMSEDHAAVLIKAMCTAAKSDGTVDEAEIAAIMGRLGQLDAEESAHLRSELAGPVDLAGLLAAVPAGLEHDVYAVSLLAIDVVSGPEASYLTELAAGLGLSDEITSKMKQAVTVR